MTDGYDLIRSYQRIFRPERRLYTIEGRALPVPGGVPLHWLGFATATLLATLALSARSLTTVTLAALVAGLAGLAAGGRTGAAVAGAATFLAVPVLGFLVSLLDWPLRLVMLPALVATLAAQATPDGRRADRYALSWLALRLRAQRRSLRRPLPPHGRRSLAAGVWVALDERSALLRPSRVRGPAELGFGSAVAVRRRPRGRVSVRSVVPRCTSRRWSLVDSIELAGGDVARVRP